MQGSEIGVDPVKFIRCLSRVIAWWHPPKGTKSLFDCSICVPVAKLMFGVREFKTACIDFSPVLISKGEINFELPGSRKMVKKCLEDSL